MARLIDKPYPGDWEIDCNKPKLVNKEIKRVEAQLDEIPDNRLLEFPVADSLDYYYIKSWEPFTLQRIPYGEFKVAESEIRNLSAEEVKQTIELQQALLGEQ